MGRIFNCKYAKTVIAAVFFLFLPLNAAERLFILSGQSNMNNLDTELPESFSETIASRFPGDEITIVKFARNSKPIANWDTGGNMWGPLATRIAGAVNGKNFDSVTFVWMQGEADALNGTDHTTYENKLLNLYERVKLEAKAEEMSWVIGRINDCYNDSESIGPNWNAIRQIQAKTSLNRNDTRLVNTDDLNDPDNDPIHMSDYPELGKRFANNAADLIQEKKKHLFILAGQSNMGQTTNVTGFKEILAQRIPNDSYKVIHDAKSGQSIGSWDEDKVMWGRESSPTRGITNKLYQNEGQEYDSVTFVWMQGEADTKTLAAKNAYQGKLHALYDRIKTYLGITEMNWVIGQINDSHTPGGEAYLNSAYVVEYWQAIRDIQAQTASERDYASLVNWDDLNGPNNTVHLASLTNLENTGVVASRYIELGHRWANAAINLLDSEPEEDTFLPVSFADFLGLVSVDADLAPAGEKGLTVSQGETVQTTTKAKSKAYSYLNADYTLTSADAGLSYSFLVGLAAEEQGRIRVRLQFTFDNGKKVNTSWVDLSDAHNTMQEIKGSIQIPDGATAISSYKVQIRQNDLNMPAQTVYLDELYIEEVTPENETAAEIFNEDFEQGSSFPNLGTTQPLISGFTGLAADAQTRATADKAKTQYYNLARNIDLNGSIKLNYSMKAGLELPEEGKIYIRLQLVFDNGLKVHKWHSLANSHTAAKSISGSYSVPAGATAITYFKLGVKQSADNIDIQKVYIDEVKVEAVLQP